MKEIFNSQTILWVYTAKQVKDLKKIGLLLRPYVVSKKVKAVSDKKDK